VLSSSSSAPVLGQTLVLTAQVDSKGAVVAPTGTVNFYDGANLIGSGTLDGNSMASMTLSASVLGKHAYKAIYSGDGDFKASASPTLARAINRDAISIALTPSGAGPFAVNQTFNLNVHVAIVAPGSGDLVGFPITIKDNGKVLGMIDLDDNGNSSIMQFAYTASGTHSLTAIYGGDANTLPATSPVLKLVVT
jgi:Bacterial Ig-like domain (group 3)